MYHFLLHENTTFDLFLLPSTAIIHFPSLKIVIICFGKKEISTSFRIYCIYAIFSSFKRACRQLSSHITNDSWDKSILDVQVKENVALQHEYCIYKINLDLQNAALFLYLLLPCFSLNKIARQRKEMTRTFYSSCHFPSCFSNTYKSSSIFVTLSTINLLASSIP